MNHDFNQVMKNRVRRIEEIMGTKAKEYAAHEDRYHNFNLAAQVCGCTPEKALWGMAMKHLVSVIDLKEWTEVSPERITAHLVDEKIGDLINYLILLEGMLYKRIVETAIKEPIPCASI